MKKRWVVWLLVLVVLATGAVFGLRTYRQHQADLKDQAAMDALRTSWSFDPNDPHLLSVRLLAVDGDTLTIGFPTRSYRGTEPVVDFVPASATFLDMGAEQIHMASKPNATLADIPLGSDIKIRAGADRSVSGSYDIYDIFVLQ